MTQSKSPTLLHGIALVAGGAIGAGMFALPLAAAGAGFMWAVFGLLLVWAMTYLACLVLLEVNTRFEPGASFDTLVRTRLGRVWARVNNFSITFIMMILMYAYTTAGASILEPLISTYVKPENLPATGLLSIVFASVVGLSVWLGTKLVGRLSAILLTAMLVTFVIANAGLIKHIDASLLALPMDLAVERLHLVWISLPVFVTAFACAGLVPSLVKHYHTDIIKAKKSLFFGTLASLLIYIVWLSTTLGTLDQANLSSVVSAGGTTGDLVSALQARQIEAGQNKPDLILRQALAMFSHFAIITSFLSIGLGLFHFIADRFSWSSDPIDKTKAALLAFAPPMLMSLLAPFGFVSAIGYAGLMVVFSFFIVPVLMLKKQRQLKVHQNYKTEIRAVPDVILNALLLFATLVIALKLATIFELLPSFR